MPTPASNKPQQAALRIKEVTDSMQLPFWDDFSFAGNTGDTLWANKKTVHISDGIAIRPRSIGVAVFDGLGESGTPYENDPVANGLRDSLVSRRIKLNDVVSANHDSVYLSFAYQWKGKGEAPDPADYLQIDFRNATNQWETVGTINVTATLDPEVFYDFFIQIVDERFFHSGFQFRIVSYGRLSGPFDTWLVDYVYLNEHRFENDLSFPDRALSTNLSPLFGEYRSVPKDHFFADPVITSASFNVINLKSTGLTVLQYKSSVSSFKYEGATITMQTDTLNNKKSIGAFLGLETQEVHLDKLPIVESNEPLFDPTADSLKVSLEVVLLSGDNKIRKAGDPIGFDYDSLIYYPIDFRSNDTIRNEYFISDYYAYDDGTAEYSAGLSQAGNLAAIRYSQLGAEKDTLTGVYIYFPELVGDLSSIVDFLVYSDNAGAPDSLLADEVVPVRRPGLDTLYKITLHNPVVVSKNFFIGWRQPINGTVAIGLDKSSDNSDKIFTNSNGVWLANTSVTGTLMMRPIFGKGDIITGIETHNSKISIFPNPVESTFIISQPVYVQNIYTITGQAITYSYQIENNQTVVTLQQPVHGLVIVILRLGNELISKKILIR